MPTYDYQCSKCGTTQSVFQTIREYISSPVRPECCGPVERKLSVVPGMALCNALANDRHYEGMIGPNGEDISSRSKHREFLKQSGLTTVDDYRGFFVGKQKEREDLRKGELRDKELKSIVTEEVTKAVAKPD